MLISILVVFVVISASLHIRAEYFGPRHQVYIFKPLTMVGILVVAVLGQAASPVYKYIVIGGLLFSMAGDVFLILPSDRFMEGLVSFLLANLFYIAAFSSEITGLSWWPMIPMLGCGIVFYLIFAPSLGAMRIPVLFYIVVILSMAWLAWERWIGGEASMAFLGAILFVISDLILALNRFRGEFKSARILNLSTYFAAQLLIAGSIWLPLGGN